MEHRMNLTSLNRRHEHGAVMVHVAIGLIAFMAISALAIDFGVKWVSRVQAQNAADAGALAGATALAFDSDSREPDGPAVKSARAFAFANPVWGQPPDVEVTDVTFPPCPPPDGDDPTGPGPFNCIRVDVYRNQVRENPLPTFFSQLVGVENQGVRAMAIAKLGEGNSLKCMLPFGVADRWADFHDPTPVVTYFANDAEGVGQGPSPLEPGINGWSANDNYDVANGDVYRSPITYPTPGQHTGWTVERDYGRQLILKLGSQGQSENPGNYSAGWANQVNLVGSNGGREYGDDISGCNDYPISIAAADETCEGYPNSETTEEGAVNGCISVQPGVDQGNTRRGVREAIDADSTAYWNPGGGEDGQGVVMNADGEDMGSPRIRPLIVFDIDHYMAQNCGGNNCMTKVGNIIGFFLEGMCNDVIAAGRLDPGMVCDDPNKQVVGRIISLPAQYFAGAGNIADDAAFLKMVILVR
jgi:hypothetical protein